MSFHQISYVPHICTWQKSDMYSRSFFIHHLNFYGNYILDKNFIRNIFDSFLFEHFLLKEIYFLKVCLINIGSIDNSQNIFKLILIRSKVAQDKSRVLFALLTLSNHIFFHDL